MIDDRAVTELEARVSSVLRSLLGALQAWRQYPPSSGPVERAVTELLGYLTQAFEVERSIVLSVEGERLLLAGQELLPGNARVATLAAALGRDGVRQIELSRGVLARELVALLEAIQAALRIGREGEDLAACLWRHDTRHVVALVAEASARGPGHDRDRQDEVELARLLAELRSAPEAGKPKAPHKLFPARAADRQIPGLLELRAEAARERALGVEPRILSAALEGFLFAEDEATCARCQGILIDLLDAAIRTGRYDRAIRVVNAVIQCGSLDNPQRSVDGWLAKAATPPRLRSIVLSPDTRAPSLLALLGPQSVPALLAVLPTIESVASRKVIIEVAASFPGWDLSLLEPIVRAERSGIALDALEILTRSRRPTAFLVMAEAYRHPSPAVRAALAEGIAQFPHDRAFGLACQLLEDTEAKVRAAAARTLGRLSHRDAARHLEALMQRPEFDAEDAEVKEAYVAAYVRQEGTRGVAWLRTLYHRGHQDTARVVLKGLALLGAEPGPRRSRAN